jgi:multiple sugar transport system substrate-binding protein
MSAVAVLVIGVLVGETWWSTQANDRTTDAPINLTLYRYFGGCSDTYAHVVEVSKAVGECGIIQVLTNRFNADHAGDIIVRTQTAEWSGYYDRLSAAYATRRPPDIAVMNRSLMAGFVDRRLLMPLKDALLQAGIPLDDFIPAAKAGVTFDGDLYGLPYDIHGLLWHLNIDLLTQAGLVDGQGPLLPSSPEELLSHAKAVREKTGKAYLAIPSQTDPMPTWTFESWVWQQEANLISGDGRTATIATPEAQRALRLLASLYEQGYANAGHDYAAAEQAFLGGEAAVLINGTWVVDSYYAQAGTPSVALRQYAPRVPPQIFGRPAAWIDSHVWVLPRQEATDDRRYGAAVTFLRYLFDHSLAWAQTGHLPARRSIVESAEFAGLPGRQDYLALAWTGRGLPTVERSRAIQDTLAQQVNATWLASEPPDEALRRAQEDVQRILALTRR